MDGCPSPTGILSVGSVRPRPVTNETVPSWALPPASLASYVEREGDHDDHHGLFDEVCNSM